ncbi:MAG: T9SS type A sorting domain-containing protein [Balneolaceae bacterium]
MGKLLLSRTLIGGLLICLIVIIWDIVPATAQIQLNSADAHQVTFTRGQSLFGQNISIISLRDIHSISHNGIESWSSDWQPWSSSVRDQNSNYFIGDTDSELSVGKSVAEDEIFSISFANSSKQPFEKVNVSFDFTYRPITGPDSFQFKLQYKINDALWRDAEGGMIHPDMLQSNSNEWNSISLQLSIDQIYLQNEDTLHFRWILENRNESKEINLPLAVQRIELEPYRASTEFIERGNVLITEIFPEYTADNRTIEYLELFNPTENSISLQGVEIHTPQGVKVIRREVYIKPYGFYLISNDEFTATQAVDSDYEYSGSLLPSSGGYVELFQNGREVAKAMYGPAEPGSSLELNRAFNAYDGYSSSQHFTSSKEMFAGSLSGSPGNEGNMTRIFKKEFINPGWAFISPPGNWINRENRNSDTGIYRLNNSENSPQPGNSPEPLFIRTQNRGSISIFAEENLTASEEDISVVELDEYSSWLIRKSPESVRLKQLVNQFSNSISPVVSVWDHERQSFRILYNGDEIIDGWVPILANRLESETVFTTKKTNEQVFNALDRFMHFKLKEGDSDDGKLLDDGALLGFLKPLAGNEDKRFDLPKLFLEDPESETEPDQSIIYLSSPFINRKVNSFTHLPHELDQAYTVQLGIFTTKPIRNATLQWTELEGIPEEWILTLTDTYTGQSVNMKEQTSYTFRSEDMNLPEGIGNRESPLVLFQPDHGNRFEIEIKPFESPLEQETEQEKPNSVELRPNYPNPFNPSTNITFYLPEERQVRLGVYNVVGQQVANLVDEPLSAGEHTLTWNASELPSGIYIVQLETGNRILTRKITLIK